MRKVTVLGLLLLVLLLLLSVPLSACSCSETDSEQPPLTSGSVVVISGSSVPTTVPPDIRGKVTSISITPEGATLLIEDDSSELTDTAYKKAKVTIDLKTAVKRESSDELVSHLDLRAGDTVEVWFSSSVEAITPVQAYAQGVKILKAEVAADSTGVVNLPRMVVNCGADSSLAVVTGTTWNGMTYNYGTAAECLSHRLGSTVSVRCGETISLSFGMTPDSVTVSYRSTDTETASIAADPVDGRIIIPQNSAGNYIYTVNVTYGENAVTYAFSIFAFV